MPPVILFLFGDQLYQYVTVCGCEKC